MRRGAPRLNAVAYDALFVLMILITVIIHELSHLAAARMAGIKVSGIQLGCGWKLMERFSGRTAVLLTDRTENLRPDWRGPEPGRVIGVYVEREPGEERYSAVAMFPCDGKPFPQDRMTELREINADRMLLRGRVRSREPDRLELADTCWTLKALPLIAGVTMAEDPGRRLPEAYNMTPWRRRAPVIAAGPLSNILLCVIILATIAAFPMHGANRVEMLVTGVQPDSPAERAGIRPGDRAVRVGNLLHPSPAELRDGIREAREKNEEIELGLTRDGRGRTVRLSPDPETGLVGMSIQARIRPPGEYPMDPGSVARRILNMGERYSRSLAGAVRGIAGGPQGAVGSPGPLAGTQQTLHSIRHTGAAGALVILATMNLIIGVGNLLPIPWQDGYRLVAGAVETVRGGRPISRRTELAMLLGWVAVIVFVAAYLIASDLTRMMGLR